MSVESKYDQKSISPFDFKAYLNCRGFDQKMFTFGQNPSKKDINFELPVAMTFCQNISDMHTIKHKQFKSQKTPYFVY